MSNPKPKARKPATKARPNRRKPAAEQVKDAMLDQAVGGSATAARLFLKLNGDLPTNIGPGAFDLDAWTAHIGTPWENLLPDNRHLLAPPQRAIVDAAIAAKRARLKGDSE